MAAIGEFGDPAEIAGAFRAEIAASQARSVVVALLVTGPLVGLLWIAVAAASLARLMLAGGPSGGAWPPARAWPDRGAGSRRQRGLPACGARPRSGQMGRSCGLILARHEITAW